ncbi:Retrotran gag 3 domain-containing protein [Abeliophyllum distichum]|uniref:Retrotran gag 3 domain-containing protein n=1 Tax=Abeliophyllum distichum TaxID=126358 RepID=A0ABD1U297_9LAMI
MSDTKTIEATIAQLDPMALQQSDHLGLILVYKPLDRNNYGQWSRAMRIALIAKNKIGFVDGKIKEPEAEDEKYPRWERRHKFHGKDVKPRNKRFTNTATISTLDPREGKILTTKEYEQIMTLLNNKKGNDKCYVNTSSINSSTTSLSNSWIIDSGGH